MAFNNIELIQKYSVKYFDEVYRAESRSSFLDGNKDLMEFVNAKTVRVPKFISSGLFDYKRNNTWSGADGGRTPTKQGYNAAQPLDDAANAGFGYQAGAMGIEWETFTLACDRAAQFYVDSMDNEEVNELAIGRGTTEISRVQLIPEVDAYCFSKLASYASASIGNLDTTGITVDGSGGTDKPLHSLNKGIMFLENHEVDRENIIIFARPSFMNLLRETSEIYKTLQQADYAKSVKFTVTEYEGMPLISVPPARFRTDIILGPGSFYPASTSKDIDYIIVDKKAVTHIVKYNKVRVFGPDVVQNFDGYKINVRIYHDLFVPDNKIVGLYVHISSTLTAIPTLSAELAEGTASNKSIVTKVDNVSGMLTNGKLYYLGLTSSTAGVKVGDALTSLASKDEVSVGVEFTPTVQDNGYCQVFVADNYGKVVACTAVLAEKVKA